MNKQIRDYILDSSEIIKNSIELETEIEKSIKIIIKSVKNGKKIIVFGNGGSAADSQHIAAEFISRFKLERKSIPAISLTTDTSIMTSISNDYIFENIFSRQCEALVSKGDVCIGISTSGNSKNVEKALVISKKKGAKTIALLGANGGKIKNIVELPIIVKSKDTAKIQEAHRVIYHIICGLVEKKIQSSQHKK